MTTNGKTIENKDASDGKKLKACTEDMALISGQKAVVTKFKKSIEKSSATEPTVPLGN